jgi:hypothetical protein
MGGTPRAGEIMICRICREQLVWDRTHGWVHIDKQANINGHSAIPTTEDVFARMKREQKERGKGVS